MSNVASRAAVSGPSGQPLQAASASGRSASAPTPGPAPSPSSTYLAGSHRLLATPARHRRARPAAVPAQAFGAAAGAWGVSDSGSSFDTLSHLASFTGFALGALLVGRELSMQQEDTEGDREMCSTCQGTGRVPCICTRWSDNDVGCGSCSNTGMAVCTDCRGGGTKVAVGRVVPIYVEEESQYRGGGRGGPYGCCASKDCHEAGCTHHEH